MRYLRDSKIIDLWLASHPNAGTRELLPARLGAPARRTCASRWPHHA